MDLVEDYTFLQKIYADLNNDDLKFELFIRTLFQQRNSCLSGWNYMGDDELSLLNLFRYGEVLPSNVLNRILEKYPDYILLFYNTNLSLLQYDNECLLHLLNIFQKEQATNKRMLTREMLINALTFNECLRAGFYYSEQYYNAVVSLCNGPLFLYGNDYPESLLELIMINYRSWDFPYNSFEMDKHHQLQLLEYMREDDNVIDYAPVVFEQITNSVIGAKCFTKWCEVSMELDGEDSKRQYCILWKECRDKGWLDKDAYEIMTGKSVGELVLEDI